MTTGTYQYSMNIFVSHLDRLAKSFFYVYTKIEGDVVFRYFGLFNLTGIPGVL